jgi:hypothetical protein
MSWSHRRTTESDRSPKAARAESAGRSHRPCLQTEGCRETEHDLASIRSIRRLRADHPSYLHLTHLTPVTYSSAGGRRAEVALKLRSCRTDRMAEYRCRRNSMGATRLPSWSPPRAVPGMTVAGNPDRGIRRSTEAAASPCVRIPDTRLQNTIRKTVYGDRLSAACRPRCLYMHAPSRKATRMPIAAVSSERTCRRGLQTVVLVLVHWITSTLLNCIIQVMADRITVYVQIVGPRKQLSSNDSEHYSHDPMPNRHCIQDPDLTQIATMCSMFFS